jgi:hypothetical protein
MIRYLLAWIPMLVIAVANGALRQLMFSKFMSELRAHQLSTVTGSVLVGAFIWIVIHLWPPVSAGEARSIGLVWLALTVAFECLIGRVLMKRSWAQVLADYNLLGGRVWVLFLIWLTIAPWVFFQLRSA